MGKKKKSVKGSPSKKGAKNKKKIDCKYEIVYEDNAPKMIFNCKECGGPHYLGDSICLRNVVKHFSKELMVEKIALSYYIDQEYYSDSLDILKQLRDLLTDLENFSLRNPKKEYFTPKAKDICTSCGLRPRTIYKKFSNGILKDFSVFYNDYSTYVKRFSTEKFQDNACQVCRERTVEECYVLLEKFKELSKNILSSAYSVKVEFMQ